MFGSSHLTNYTRRIKKKLLQITPTLEEYSYDVAIIHVGINDILRSKHYDELDKLLNS